MRMVVSVVVEPDRVDVMMLDVVNVERKAVLPIIDDTDKLDT